MSRHLLVVFLTATLAVNCGRPPRSEEPADSSLQRVRTAGKLRVAVDATYPPMEFAGPNGQLAGFDIDLAHALAGELGVRAEFVVMSWDGIVAGLTSGRYDVILSSMNITRERSQQLAFIEYARMGQVFLVRQGKVVSGEQDLADKVVAVQAGTTSQHCIDEMQRRRVPIRAVKAFKDAPEVFASLAAGQADVAIVDEPVGRYYARQQSRGLAITGQAAAPEPIGAAVLPKERALHAALSRAVEALRRDGRMRQFEEKWFGVAPEHLGFWTFSLRVAIPAIGRGLILTLGLTLGSGLTGLALGLALALGRTSRRTWLRHAALAYVTLWRGTPLLLQILFIYFALPPLLHIRLDALSAGWLALSLNMGAYACEIIRAAIQSIDPGQMEAARALGMSSTQAMRHIILPQALRRLLPPLVNEFAALSKDTSLVSALALHEMLYVTQRLAAAYLRPWEVYLWAALGYLVIVLVLTALASWLDQRLETRGG